MRFKSQTVPGNVEEDLLSDVGSILTVSTRKTKIIYELYGSYIT